MADKAAAPITPVTQPAVKPVEKPVKKKKPKGPRVAFHRIFRGDHDTGQCIGVKATAHQADQFRLLITQLPEYKSVATWIERCYPVRGNSDA